MLCTLLALSAPQTPRVYTIEGLDISLPVELKSIRSDATISAWSGEVRPDPNNPNGITQVINITILNLASVNPKPTAERLFAASANSFLGNQNLYAHLIQRQPILIGTTPASFITGTALSPQPSGKGSALYYSGLSFVDQDRFYEVQWYSYAARDWLSSLASINAITFRPQTGPVGKLERPLSPENTYEFPGIPFSIALPVPVLGVPNLAVPTNQSAAYIGTATVDSSNILLDIRQYKTAPTETPETTARKTITNFGVTGGTVTVNPASNGSADLSFTGTRSGSQTAGFVRISRKGNWEAIVISAGPTAEIAKLREKTKITPR